jgi:hypothetical protein
MAAGMLFGRRRAAPLDRSLMHVRHLVSSRPDAAGPTATAVPTAVSEAADDAAAPAAHTTLTDAMVPGTAPTAATESAAPAPAAGASSDDDDGDADGDADDATAGAAAASGTAAAKKKKKKKKKKKAAAPGAGEAGTGATAAAGGSAAAGTPTPAGSLQPGQSRPQTSPPSLPVRQLFPNGVFPPGQIMEYQNDSLKRISSEEKRALERLSQDVYNDIRKAAEVHRQVRHHMQKVIKPGMTMMSLCEQLESTVVKLIEAEGLKAGAWH